MDKGFGKGVRTPKFVVELGAELECWRKFIKRFEIAVIGAGLKLDEEGATGTKSRAGTAKEKAKRFELEQRKAALLLDSMGELGMNLFETWDVEVGTMQYEGLKGAFEEHFSDRENIVATRHRFLCLEQRSEEGLDKFIERVERAGKTCRFGGLEEEMVVQIVIKGMRLDKVRNELLLKKDLSLGKVKSVCNRYESAVAASKIIKKSHPVSEVDRVEVDDGELAGEEDAQVDRIGAFGVRGRGSRRGRGRGRGCWTCGGFGHDFKACKSRMERNKEQTRGGPGPKFGKCFICDESNHFARDCPKRGAHGRVNAVEGCLSDSDQESL